MIRPDFEQSVQERLCAEGVSGGDINVLAKKVGGNRFGLAALHLRAHMAQPVLDVRKGERVALLTAFGERLASRGLT